MGMDVSGNSYYQDKITLKRTVDLKLKRLSDYNPNSIPSKK